MKIFRITAWIKRFTLKTRKPANLTDVSTAEELKDAEEFWIRRIQRVAYNSEISALENDKSISKKSSIFFFSPFLDDKGILWLGGRLQFSDFSTEEKHPLLLPRNSKFTELITERDNKLMHSGVTATLTSFRKEYWIPKSRQLIKKILRNCLICRKYTAKPAQQMTAQLPKYRIVQTPPFLVSEMDFAGPVWVRSETGTEQSYIVLFT
ncbi:uncharacterized protein LOC118195700 [Stegodyphus dumicola]|uniref:uncharacterized protein LOC118195700 n=1 Tax=Stegodyphus dumicola TaxID=202533 RepID=UPI0015A99D6D|nr:uncharacterized protein LOC118195700 [Stegodyphus dumicola]